MNEKPVFQHRCELVDQPRVNEYTDRCARCGAVQFGLLKGQI